MTDNAAAPLLSGQRPDEEVHSDREESATTSSGPKTVTRSFWRSQTSGSSDERTPLLSGDEVESHADEFQDEPDHYDVSTKKSRVRWPTLVALAFLSSLVILILGFAFAAPAVVEEYSREAVAFEPNNLSIESFTTTGVNARIRGDFVVDASRVKRKPVRDLGRLGTWIAKAVESKPTTVRVYLPQYDNLLLGSADVPGIVVSVRDGERTPIDFVAQVSPGNVDGIRRIANDWLEGRLGSLEVIGKADIPIKSGIFSFGTQHIIQQLLFEGKSVPSVPKYKITKALIHEVEVDGQKAMAADLALQVFNKYPITFHIPGMAFDILVPGCPAVGDLIVLANATTQDIDVKPEKHITARARGVVRQLPKMLIDMCPGTDSSPLDALLKNYMHGSKATVYVRGSSEPHKGVPQWISDFIKDVTVPVSLPSRSFDGLIRNFTMADTHFSLPDPLADPDTPEGSPSVSSIIKVIANLPEEMNFPVEIKHIRANADVFYKKRKLGILDLKDWQKANSTRIYPHDDVPSGIAIDARIDDAPLHITDNAVFTEIIQEMLFGGNTVILDVNADVDVETHTALGKFVVRGVPASGRVPIKQPGGKGFDMRDLALKIHSLEITDTSRDSISMAAKVNVTNPTNYTATIPFVDINIMINKTIVGHATARNINVGLGENHNLQVHGVWEPVAKGGETAREVAKNFLSQFVSGYNTTLQFSTHRKTIPALPGLGAALSNITLEIQTPKLKPPKNPNRDPDDPNDPDDDGKNGRFIQDATFHLFSSSADFTLLSPLTKSTLYLTHINATALYNRTEPIGNILYDVPFAVPPGASTTPRLPVEWDVLSVGYEAIREAIGGSLKLDAEAEVSLRLGKWEQDIWFKGGGIGARVRP